MDIQYIYQKKRSEFGRQCLFSDRGPELIDNYPPNRSFLKEYILKDPVSRSQQGAPVYAEVLLNTTRAEFTNSGMNHVEGGWPRDVNMMDEEQTKRYKRKVEKDDNYAHTLMALCKSMENCVLQNNAINIYQQYFSDVDPTPLAEKCSARTVNVFLDTVFPSRPITHISWSPDGQTKIANSHCNLVYRAGYSQNTESFIWDIENPNKPLYTCRPEHPMVCLEYHPKDPHSLVSGHINGQVGVIDTRKGTEPVEFSKMESSFRDPVQRVAWINTKSGQDFFSGSSDGQVKWWDARKLSEPTETLILHPVRDDDQNLSEAMGCSCLEYEPTIPTRFMVGTEQGYVLGGNRKGKNAVEKMGPRYQAHIGPVLTIQRSPQFVKNFLTIGDWTARIWSEDCKESAIMWTKYHRALLTDGAWSPMRLSCFFTARDDGILDVWDILQNQRDAIMAIKVCDEPLTKIKTHDSGRIVAVANKCGTLFLVELSEGLAQSSKNDKVLLTSMFERESKREKILEAKNRELRLKLKIRSSQLIRETPGEEVKDADEDEEVDEEQEDEELSEDRLSNDDEEFKDEFVDEAEEDFNDIMGKELNKDKPVIKIEGSDSDVKDDDDDDDDVNIEEIPPPPPSESPDIAPKKGKSRRPKILRDANNFLPVY